MTLINGIKKLIHPFKGSYYFSSDNPRAPEVNVLVHGLIRRGRCFVKLGRLLAANGYPTYVYDYDTTMHSIAEHGAALRRYLEKIAAENPESKINIITHSMGGLLTRYALGNFSENYDEKADESVLKRSRIKHVIMLGPPNKGSDIARF